MQKTMMELVTEIVSGQSSQKTLTGDEIANLIRQTYRALKEIETLESRGGTLEDIDIPYGVQSASPQIPDYGYDIKPATSEPKIPPEQSIQDERIICIECGEAFKTLTHTHLGSHGLTPHEYKDKWGIPKSQPLSARSVSERRKEAAKQKNVGEALKQARMAARSGQAKSGELFQPKATPEQEKE